uniref:Uncharacterized protein n=1 Tax=Romanomermis culicivorax TaxID=13658 RepID=A0A915KLI6_ROMCU
MRQEKEEYTCFDTCQARKREPWIKIRKLCEMVQPDSWSDDNLDLSCALFYCALMSGHADLHI